MPNTRGQSHKRCLEIVKKYGYDAPSIHEAMLIVALCYLKYGERLLKCDNHETFYTNTLPKENTYTFCDDYKVKYSKKIIDNTNQKYVVGAFDQYNKFSMDLMKQKKLDELKNYIGMCGVKRVYPQKL